MLISLQNRIISILKDNYFRLTEPIKLIYLRFKYEKFYGPDEPEPFIFIYTPTYNRGEILIERAVKSVQNQSYKNFIYLIVGDFCTDNTESLLSKITDPRIKFINLKKRGYRYPPTAFNHWLAGPVVAANVALAHVPEKCSWIARIDDDDIWTNDHLQSVLSFALQGNYEFVSSCSLTVRKGIEKIVRGEYLYGEYFQEPFPTSKKYVYNPKIGSTNTTLYRSYLKSFKFNLDCYRKKHNRVNDIDLWHRMGRAGVRMGFLEQVTHHIIPRPGETTIGSDAYIMDSHNKEIHYNFK